ncbi:rhomboid family intramembrane serine protease [Nonomuraea sp. NPDC050556]|uniref:rhomboid family intramembrane serine protease n=1 Tax=Nonomuraea sp. NPDC050556 TaxID=3364369 RepID=UPI0037B0CF32
MRRFPIVTLVVFLVTAVPSTLQFFLPGLEPALMRVPGSGDWWRTFTSLVVQDGGVGGTVFNLACLAVIGYFTEQTFGPWRWLLLYAGGAAAGQAAGYLFGDPGAGNSIAVCGLAAGLAYASGSLERSIAGFYAAAMLTTALSSVVIMVVACAAAFQLIVQRNRLPYWTGAALAAASGIFLTVIGNLHGPALLGGLAVGAAIRRNGRLRRGEM